MASPIDGNIANALSDMLSGIAEDFSGPNETGTKYGIEIDNEVFMMNPFCWCDKEDCPWCASGGDELCDPDKGIRCEECPGVRFADKGAVDCNGAPNFWHKASGLRVWWYKYIGRGMESNIPIDRDFLRRVEASCMSYLKSASGVRDHHKRLIDAVVEGQPEADMQDMRQILETLAPNPDDVVKVEAFSRLAKRLQDANTTGHQVAAVNKLLDRYAVADTCTMGFEKSLLDRVDEVVVRYLILLEAMRDLEEGADAQERCKTAFSAIAFDEIGGPIDPVEMLLLHNLSVEASLVERALSRDKSALEQFYSSQRKLFEARVRDTHETSDSSDLPL